MCTRVLTSEVPDPSFSLRVPASAFNSGVTAAVDITSLGTSVDSMPKATIVRAYAEGRDWWLTGVSVLTTITRITLRETNNNGRLLSVFPPGANHASNPLPPDWVGLLGLQIETGDTAPDVWLEFTAYRRDDSQSNKNQPCE